MFSRRSETSLEPNALSTALGEARARGALRFDLTTGNPTTAGIPYDNERVQRAFAPSGALRYEPEPFGLASARAAIAELWAERGVQVSAERVLVTVSTSEAYAFAFKLLCDTGDEVLVPTPSYPLLEHLAVLEGVRLVHYPLVYERGWFIDVPALARAVTERTRAVVLVSPNNPTGSCVKKTELVELAGLGLPIISDEVFAEYPLRRDPTRALSALEAGGVLVLALDGLSKLAALPQAKLAWMTVGGPEALVRPALARLELIADTFLSPSTVTQLGLAELLASRNVAGDAIRARLLRNQRELARAVADSAVTALDVEAGWYAVLRLPDLMSDDDWALRFLRDGVSVQPGYFFDLVGPPHVVVSLLTPEAVFAEGMAHLVRCVVATLT